MAVDAGRPVKDTIADQTECISPLILEPFSGVSTLVELQEEDQYREPPL